ncbi:MAG: 16S rRNA (adenine(1518)-N(6)/adenine(1519)-N(6))-dimethyltransferase RsmA [Bacteriovorax sp.]|nr:16S rRNA (adenine(1518)-N(6)/adenine(1519)-N(6))-dimethyltransferase RsmA [Bacteriovorax sp.]
MSKVPSQTRLELPSPDKSLGQHFLRDQNIIQQICHDFKDQAEAIVEIGPGPGILTEHLALMGLPYFVIEKDTRFGVYLDQFLNKDQITLDDALQVELSTFFKEKNISGKKIWLVSNLPYNIATPLLVNFLQATDIKYMTLMFQKEVADKVFPFATTKNFMGSLLVLCQSFFECNLLVKVPPGAFAPPPKVDSAVITFVRREIPLVPMAEFRTLEKFLRQMFSQRRKQIGGVLKSYYKPEIIKESFDSLGLSTTLRSEVLTLEHVLELYRKLRS